MTASLPSEGAETAMARLEARVLGRVHGVFFRDHTQREAQQLGLAGYVRNLPDGSVEAVAEGPRAALERLVQKLWAGSSSARVDDVVTRWVTATGEFSQFEIRF